MKPCPGWWALRAAGPRVLLVLGLAGIAGSLQAAPPPPAHGLIVKLRDAPSHEALERERALGAGDPARSAVRREGLQRARVLQDAGIAPLEQRPAGRDAWLLRFERPLAHDEAERLAERLRQRPEVEWVVPNEREHRLQAVPNDPRFVSGDQWWLKPVSGSDGNVIADRLRGVPGFQSAWARGVTGLAAVRVAVLDTGIVPHAELAGRLLTGYDFVSELAYANDGDGRDPDPSDPGDWVSAAEAASKLFEGCEVEDSSWHGTINANLIGALTNDATSVAAALWDVRIQPVRVAGKCGADVADIVDGMRWAAGLHVSGVPDNPTPARILNISFGGSAACNAAYQGAIDELRSVGAVVVAAGGNEHASQLMRPASCQRVAGVVALNRDGFKANYSNFGSAAAIATVGGDDSDPAAAWSALLADSGLLTLGNSGRTSPGATEPYSVFGTSFATPLVSATLALMLSANPALSADQLLAGLQASARPHVISPVIGVCSDANPGRCLCTTSTCGAGIADAEQAVLFALAPGSYVRPAAQGAFLDSAELRQASALGLDRPPNVSAPPPSSGGGGGAMHAGWLIGLLAASLLLARGRRRPRP